MEKTLFDLYTDCLLSSFGPVTATRLSQLLDGAISHAQVTRLLAGEPKRSAYLWPKVKPLVRAVENPAGVIVIDDSIAENPDTDENELISGHWNQAENRAVKGSSFLTAFYQVGPLSLPVAFDLVTETKTYLATRRSAKVWSVRMNACGCCCASVSRTKSRLLMCSPDLWYASADKQKTLQWSHVLTNVETGQRKRRGPR